jgi:REP element-mobilizing transposase RayT
LATSRDHGERSASKSHRGDLPDHLACYGAHLHGDEAGSVDRLHNQAGTRPIAGDPGRVKLERRLMDQPPYIMNQVRRDAVLAALLERSSHRGWNLLAAHVRENHVHVVIAADVLPQRIMNDLKSYASRVLNRLEIDESDRKRWARHGSTRWLAEAESVVTAIRYVVEKQGDPMAVYLAPDQRC